MGFFDILEIIFVRSLPKPIRYKYIMVTNYIASFAFTLVGIVILIFEIVFPKEYNTDIFWALIFIIVGVSASFLNKFWYKRKKAQLEELNMDK